MNREKHFLVVRVIEPEPPAVRIEQIELQAVHSGRVRQLHWRELTDRQVWRQGWV
ncbi:MAG: TIGR02450 family Trp-rich protein [Burkholderiaceae bacterium]|nr:TIGR02450 family Trp-rich protein [Burkholderiaceae bacterium]